MQQATIEWHPVKCVPFDPEKHADLFEKGEEPEFVWEGDLPDYSGDYLVTYQWIDGSRSVCMEDYDVDYPGFNDDDVIAWAELPEPFKEEQS